MAGGGDSGEDGCIVLCPRFGAHNRTRIGIQIRCPLPGPGPVLDQVVGSLSPGQGPDEGRDTTFESSPTPPISLFSPLTPHGRVQTACRALLLATYDT